MVINGKTYTVAELMRPAILIEDTATLRDVLERMVSEKRNSLTVVDAEGAFVGAVNALDIIKAVLPDYLEKDQVAAQFGNFDLLKEDAKRVEGVLVTEIMAKNPPTVSVSVPILSAAVMAAKDGRGRITVVDEDNKPVGILTRTEIKQIIGQTLDICGDCFE